LLGIRPDWDLSTPGLRQAWDAGDVSPFHGWNNFGIAEGFAAAGASVAVMSRSPDKVDAAVRRLRALGAEAGGSAADVRDPDATATALQQAHESFGEIDVLVSGAAGNFPASAGAPPHGAAVPRLRGQGRGRHADAGAGHGMGTGRDQGERGGPRPDRADPGNGPARHLAHPGWRTAMRSATLAR
jgi:hypothetical protein